jgi:DNA (cytosine-5)-methyltransferase 1
VMRYISLFSGIEAASVAFDPLGWEPICFAEIDPFASAVLKERFPHIRNVGDVTSHEWTAYGGRCDLVIGGPPCQAFSIAGKRLSLADDRGNLSLAYVKAVDAIDPVWCITENVPGWLSTADNAFGCFLAAMVGADAALVPSRGQCWTDAGVVAGPRRTAAWRVCDAQYFGVPQRRRRVFVVAVRGAGNWACAEAIIPLRESLCGNHPPGREEGQRVARPVASSPEGGSGYSNDANTADNLIAAPANSGIAGTLDANYAKGPGERAGVERTMVLAHAFNNTAENLIAASSSGAGYWREGLGTLTARDWRDGEAAGLIAYGGNNTSGPIDVATAVNAHGGPHGRLDFESETFVVPPFMARSSRGGAQTLSPGFQTDGHIVTHAPTAPRSTQGNAPFVVRRLTVEECEALQGLPRGYTNIEYRGKPAADGPRYGAIGNSMAVPVIRWLGRRIALVEAGLDA